MSISELSRNLSGAALRGSFLVTLGKGLGQEELSYLGVVTLDRGFLGVEEILLRGDTF